VNIGIRNKNYMNLTKSLLTALDGHIDIFISTSMKQFTPAERRGTPKGEPIGFSKRKYHAALLSSLSNYTIREIAETCNVSYGLLRKWRTETAFRRVETFVYHCFVNLLMDDEFIIAGQGNWLKKQHQRWEKCLQGEE
jgi:hypothetical protein